MSSAELEIASFVASLSPAAAVIYNAIQSKKGGGAEEKETAELRREIRRAQKKEYKEFYKPMFNDNSRMRALAMEGIKMRETRLNQSGYEDARSRIYKTYGPEGLHVVQAIQMGLPEAIHTDQRDLGIAPSESQRQVREFLEQIDRKCRFIHDLDQVEDAAHMWVLRGRTLVHQYLVIAGSGHQAAKAEEVSDIVAFNLEGSYEEKILRDKVKFACILRKKSDS